MSARTPEAAFDASVAYLTKVMNMPPDRAQMEAAQFVKERFDIQDEPEGSPDPRDTELAELRARLDHVEKGANTAQAQILEKELSEHVMRSLDSDQDSRMMKEELKRLNGDTAVASVQQRIRERTFERLEARNRQSGGKFDRRWITEEVANARKDVLSSVRSVIGDSSLIGRSAETAGGPDISRLRKQAPVARPRISSSTPESAVDDWLGDSLIRSSLEMGGGPDRV